ESADVISLLFTSAELYKADKQKFIRMLSVISAHARRGTRLFLVEPAGSYSNITVGTKTFSLQILLDHILRDSWETIYEDDSHWVRLPHLRYNLPLEDSRHFYRVYI
ncbi:hypothetical protein CANCADRAFT_17542, partial [Tortispora caseinolytica NRRL Y-17796]